MKRRSVISALAVVLVMAAFGGCGKTEPVESNLTEESEQSVSDEPSVAESEESMEELARETDVEDVPMEWNDEDLKRYMQAVTGITDRDIMLSDLAGVEELDLSWYGRLGDWEDMENIRFISDMPNLKVLSLNLSMIQRYEMFADPLEPLELPASLESLTVDTDMVGQTSINGTGIHICSLPNLSRLTVWLSDMDTLEDLPALTELEVHNTEEAEDDFSHVADFPGLTRLKLAGRYGVSGIEVLSGLTNLETLNLEDCIYSDDFDSVDALSGLTNLKTLYVRHAAKYMSVIAGLENLQELRLDYSGWSMESIPDLTSLHKLETLGLKDTEIRDFDWLTALPGLTKLDLNSCTITDISGLSGLTNLKKLSLQGCKVNDDSSGYQRVHILDDVSGLSGLTNLTELDLSNCDITDVSPLVGLTNLTKLNLSMGFKGDLSQLSGLTNLTELDLSGCRSITDVAPLSGLTNLTRLDLSGCDITDVTPLSSLTNLTRLDLGGCRIADVAPLSGLTNLTELILHSCRITDVTPLSGLTNLTELDLHFCRSITDVTPLSSLTKLESLDISGNNLTDYSAVSFVPNLRK